MRLTRIVIIFDIKLEKKKTKARIISNLKNVNRSENKMSFVISISLKKRTPRNKSDCARIIRRIVAENQKNFHKINSYLAIGLLKIRKIVFPSISLKRS
jgi:hypothetical protein